jgi:hypothetical protein
MRTYGSGGVVAAPFLTSTLDGGKWSASRPGRLTSWERTPGTHWIGGWVGPRTDLDVVEKRKDIFISPGIETWPSNSC